MSDRSAARNEGDLSNTDRMLSGLFADDEELRGMLDSVTVSDQELRQMLEAVTPTEEELRQMLEAVTPTEEELRQTLEALTPTEEELRQTLEAVTPTAEELRQTLEAVTPTEEELAWTIEQLRDDPDLQERLDQIRSGEESASAPEPRGGATAAEVANWMNDQLGDRRRLYQSTVAYAIRRRFGREHVYLNQNRNLAISRDVLAEFRALTPDVVWERHRRAWRTRRPGDPEGQRQVD